MLLGPSRAGARGLIGALVPPRSSWSMSSCRQFLFNYKPHNGTYRTYSKVSFVVSSYCPLLRFFLPCVSFVPPVAASRRSFMGVAVRKAPVLRVILSTARGLPLRLMS